MFKNLSLICKKSHEKNILKEPFKNYKCFTFILVQTKSLKNMTEIRESFLNSVMCQSHDQTCTD